MTSDELGFKEGIEALNIALKVLADFGIVKKVGPFVIDEVDKRVLSGDSIVEIRFYHHVPVDYRFESYDQLKGFTTKWANAIARAGFVNVSSTVPSIFSGFQSAHKSKHGMAAVNIPIGEHIDEIGLTILVEKPVSEIINEAVKKATPYTRMLGKGVSGSGKGPTTKRLLGAVEKLKCNS